MRPSPTPGCLPSHTSASRSHLCSGRKSLSRRDSLTPLHLLGASRPHPQSWAELQGPGPGTSGSTDPAVSAPHLRWWRPWPSCPASGSTAHAVLVPSPRVAGAVAGWPLPSPQLHPPPLSTSSSAHSQYQSCFHHFLFTPCPPEQTSYRLASKPGVCWGPWGVAWRGPARPLLSTGEMDAGLGQNPVQFPETPSPEPLWALYTQLQICPLQMQTQTYRKSVIYHSGRLGKRLLYERKPRVAPGGPGRVLWAPIWGIHLVLRPGLTPLS